MEPKKMKIYLAEAIFGFVAFIIACYIYTKKVDQHFAKMIEIKREDNINIQVTHTWEDHGVVFFNDSLYTSSSKIIYTHALQMYDIDKLELPFYLRKDADNDTMWFADSNMSFCFILKEEQPDTEHEMTFDEFGELIKKALKILMKRNRKNEAPE